MSELDDFRRAKDRFFREGRRSPLTREQRYSFRGLSYFPEDAALRLVVEPEVLPDPDAVELELSAGDSAVYERWAKVRFEVDGCPAELTIFRAAQSGDMFLPFRDATAASGETYGAGRYLDVHQLPDGRLLLDFNYAYNPYCAYNEQWSCPLTPCENVIQVPIRAGEKSFPWVH